VRLSDETRYPHPVLGPLTNDYTEGEFQVLFSVSENIDTGALTLDYDITLNEISMRDLVISGEAIVGCIVVCQDTYYNRLHKLSFNKGSIDFPAGKLINRVTLRPIISLNADKLELKSPYIHPEFGSPILTTRADIIAIDDTSIIYVGKAKLAPLESIFELILSPEMKDGTIKVGLDSERIAIFLGPKTFNAINLLRNKNAQQNVIMSAVYLPAVMDVLDQVRSNGSDYIDRRWHMPFTAKCDLKGINGNTPLLQAAQELLNDPINELVDILIEGNPDDE
jgi:hypothetical protein